MKNKNMAAIAAASQKQIAPKKSVEPKTLKKGQPTKKIQQSNKKISKLQKVTKIYKLPKDVQSSIPFIGCMQNGIIETEAGVFSKTYRFDDANFTTASMEEQENILNALKDFLNSFDADTRWQITIYNHAANKQAFLNKMRIKPQNDKLDFYRAELTRAIAKNYITGNNTVTQEKYLTLSIEDVSVDHANSRFINLETAINTSFKQINGTGIKPLSITARLKMLYEIYNQDYGYRFLEKTKSGKEVFDFEHIAQMGLSVKDIVGPSGFDFRKSSTFMTGDTYGQGFAMIKMRKEMNTDLLNELSNIQCTMLTSVTTEAIASDVADKMARNMLTSIDGSIYERQSKNAQQGLYGMALPKKLEEQRAGADSLIDEMHQNDQKLFLSTLTVVLFAPTEEELALNSEILIQTAKRMNCVIIPLRDQQEFVLNTALPLGRNDLYVNRLLTTRSELVFLPFNSKEINQENGIFYGINKNTKSPIVYDRTKGQNYNGIIFGTPGSGKSFTAKIEIITVLLNKPNAQIFIIDPQGEDYPPLAQALGGTVIPFAIGKEYRLNPLDLDLSSDDETDPVALQADYTIGLLETMNKRPFKEAVNGKLEHLTMKMYDGYVEAMRQRTDGVTINTDISPTLNDLKYMIEHELPEYATDLCGILERYTTGAFSFLSGRTNINTDSRLVVYDVSKAGGARDVVMYICAKQIFSKMPQNRRRGIWTYCYIDEFHMLLKSPSTIATIAEIWKIARKWHGVMTAITQNTSDMVNGGENAKKILENTNFALLLSSDFNTRQDLMTLFKLSESQIAELEHPERGCGLIKTEDTVIPFEMHFPEDLKLFDIMQTSKQKGAELSA